MVAKKQDKRKFGLFVILLAAFFFIVIPFGKADVSLSNQFIQLVLQAGQTQDPFTIKNATGSTLVKLDVNSTLTINDENGNPSTVIGPRSGNEDYSYLIFTDGTTIYAKNGSRGVVEFSGTVPELVINNAISALDVDRGGTVIIKGNYNLSQFTSFTTSAISGNASILVHNRNKVKLICEDGKFTTDYTSYPSGNKFIFSFILTNDSSIEGCELDGSAMTTDPGDWVYGIYLKLSNNILAYRNYIHDLYGFQIFVSSSENGINYKTTIEQNRIRGVGTNDPIGGGGGNVLVFNNEVKQVLKYGNYEASVDIVDMNTTQILNNKLWGYVGISSEGGSHDYSEISGNTVYPAIEDSYSSTSIYQNYSIIIMTTPTHNEGFSIQNNILDRGIKVNEGSGFVIANNKIISAPAEGISLGYGSIFQYRQSIYENEIAYSKNTAIETLNCEYCNIHDNIINSTDKYGIWLRNTSNSSVHNNLIISTTDDQGIVISAPSYANFVSGNRVNSFSTPIWIYGGSNTTVMNNILSGGTIYSILVNNNGIDNIIMFNTGSLPIELGTNSKAFQNVGYSGFNHGNSAITPTPFGAGDTFYNTSSNKMAYYNGTDWIQYP